MNDKELQEYKQKLKGLSPKELNDILSHINKDKVPEKYHAVECEIALRSGTAAPEAPSPAPKAEAPKQEASKQETTKAPEAPKPAPAAPAAPTIQLRKSKIASAGPATPLPEFKSAPPVQPVAAMPTPSPTPAPAPVKAEVKKPAAAGSAPAGKFGSMVLMAASVLLILGGVYFLLVPFVNVPGAAALRAIMTKLPPHF